MARGNSSPKDTMTGAMLRRAFGWLALAALLAGCGSGGGGGGSGSGSNSPASPSAPPPAVPNAWAAMAPAPSSLTGLVPVNGKLIGVPAAAGAHPLLIFDPSANAWTTSQVQTPADTTFVSP